MIKIIAGRRWCHKQPPENAQPARMRNELEHCGCFCFFFPDDWTQLFALAMLLSQPVAKRIAQSALLPKRTSKQTAKYKGYLATPLAVQSLARLHKNGKCSDDFGCRKHSVTRFPQCRMESFWAHWWLDTCHALCCCNNWCHRRFMTIFHKIREHSLQHIVLDHCHFCLFNGIRYLFPGFSIGNGWKDLEAHFDIVPCLGERTQTNITQTQHPKETWNYNHETIEASAWHVSFMRSERTLLLSFCKVSTVPSLSCVHEIIAPSPLPLGFGR